MSASRKNFFTEHWDLLVLVAGLAALAGSVVLLLPALGESPDEASSAYAQQLGATRPAHEGVAAADMSVFVKASRLAKTPPAMAELDPKKASFLASERRVLCQKGDPDAKEKACGKPIPAGLEKCPLCGIKQKFVKVEVDTDHDGLPNDWEKKYGLAANDPADAAKDADKDGFTNLEEFQAKTDPKDPESHPDYLDFLAVDGALKQTKLPFYFNDVQPIPGGHRFTFQRLGKGGYDSKFTPKLNEEIANARVKTGWTVTAYEQKSAMVPIPGSKSGAKRKVDVSVVTVKRAKDGKTLTLTRGHKDNTIESQADLAWSRGEGLKLTVAEGTEFTLKNRRYRVTKLAEKDNACLVTVLDLTAKKEKILH